MHTIILNLIILSVNCILFILITIKFSEIKLIQEKSLSLKSDFDELLHENIYLSTQYLDSLEKNISEGKKFLQDLTEKEEQLKKGVIFTEEEQKEQYNPITLEIAKLLKQGKSITEIAEKLKTTKGEVVLRLNLGEKIAGQKEKNL